MIITYVILAPFDSVTGRSCTDTEVSVVMSSTSFG
jgi:hypothetical protein